MTTSPRPLRHAPASRRSVLTAAAAVGGSALVPAGVVTLAASPAHADEILLSSDFSSGTPEGWYPRGPVTLAVDAADYLLVYDRTATWDGAAIDITEHVEVGIRYQLKVSLRLLEGTEAADLRTTVQRDVAGSSSYDTVQWNTAVTDAAWTEFSGTYSVSQAADRLQFYVESDSSLAPIMIDSFTLTRIDDPEIEDLLPLKDFLACDFPIGCAVEPAEVVGRPAELLALHFAQVTTGNQMKPDAIQPTEGVFDFTRADQIVDFAEANGMQVWGHTLLWHNQTPAWWFLDADGQPLQSTRAHRRLVLDRFKAHVEALAEHYGDRVWAWDVVNEVLDPEQTDGLRRSRWYEIFGGGEYIGEAFKIARRAFPRRVKLFINDYNTEFPDKREAMYNLVQELKRRRVPVDGIGHQAHVDYRRDPQLLGESIDAFKRLRVLQAVTELDVSVSDHMEESLPETPPERLVEQGWYYKELFEVLRERADDLESVTMWGLYDAVSWLRNWPVSRPHEAPLFFDDRLQAKAAYWGVVDPTKLEPLPEG
ncbi:endo-1,4-beta-xylanase [Glycomyces sp. A-F 0318]|uniref:endo-1,4-beta-xylanase n=1 Tax=Glycomyces amatae TaxID=2881355 RepID=UPI001E48A66A|nr:endo-1,4-beta-xylanase [Glycomyces amatae]MCD0445983.1 endo-1,4-beta-xylanase [Glycomyces amatae]